MERVGAEDLSIGPEMHARASAVSGKGCAAAVIHGFVILDMFAVVMFCLFWEGGCVIRCQCTGGW